MTFFNKKKDDELADEIPENGKEFSESLCPDAEKVSPQPAKDCPPQEANQSELPIAIPQKTEEHLPDLEKEIPPLAETLLDSLPANSTIEVTLAPQQQEERSGCDETQAKIFTLVFKYGALNAAQIAPYCDGLDTANLSQWGMSMLEINGEKVYLHSQDSLDRYAGMTGISWEKLQKKALIGDTLEIEKIPAILQEIEICLAFDNASGQGGYQFYDWLSPNNPRKKRMIKISRPDGKRGCLEPDMLVVFKKNSKKFCLVMEWLPAYEAFSEGERCEDYQQILLAYDSWLSAPEKVKEWLQRRKVLVAPESTGVALLYNASETGNDLSDICRELSITTPIFFAAKSAFLAKPFWCWQSHGVTVEQNFPLKLRRSRKR